MQTGDQRKAAILFRSLDAETAASLLAQLEPAEADALRQAVREHQGCDGEERSDVLAEFRRAAATAAENLRDAVEIDPQLLADADALEVPQLPEEDSSQSLLAGTDPRLLIPLLAREHAQTVALVLSRLAASQAADVLAALPEPIQRDVIWRLSVLGESDPESLREVEQQLVERLAGQSSCQVDPTARTAHVAGILAAIDPVVRASALSHLEHRDRQLAGELAARLNERSRAERSPLTDASRRALPVPEEPSDEPSPVAELPDEPALCESIPPVTAAAESRESAVPDPPTPLRFEQLAGLDAGTLAAVLSEVPPHVTTLALAGAEEALVGRVTERLSWRAARRLRRKLRLVGPVRLSDVAQAQETLAEAATRHLASQRGRHVRHSFRPAGSS